MSSRAAGQRNQGIGKLEPCQTDGGAQPKLLFVSSPKTQPKLGQGTPIDGGEFESLARATSRGGTDSQFFQLRKGPARNAKVFIHRVYSDLREAISIEKRYFTSDLSSLS